MKTQNPAIIMKPKTASHQAKLEGLKNLTHVSELTGVQMQTLNNWFHHKPKLFWAVLKGCRVMVNDEIEITKNTYFMHRESGEVASQFDWHSDYESMDKESWFGKEIDLITDADKENWLDGGHLIEVVRYKGEWIELN